jgi:hypothetical protein
MNLILTIILAPIVIFLLACLLALWSVWIHGKIDKAGGFDDV